MRGITITHSGADNVENVFVSLSGERLVISLTVNTRVVHISFAAMGFHERLEFFCIKREPSFDIMSI